MLGEFFLIINVKYSDQQKCGNFIELNFVLHFYNACIVFIYGIFDTAINMDASVYYNTCIVFIYRIFDTAINMDTSVYVSYTIKQMHMEQGAKLFIYLILNKVGYQIMFFFPRIVQPPKLWLCLKS